MLAIYSLRILGHFSYLVRWTTYIIEETTLQTKNLPTTTTYFQAWEYQYCFFHYMPHAIQLLNFV